MATYKVLSDNCTLGVKGTTIVVADDTGINYDALVSGEHLEEVKSQTPKPIKEGN